MIWVDLVVKPATGRTDAAVLNQHLDGQVVDMGDVLVQTRWIVKGLRQPTLGWHIGPVLPTVQADRIIQGTDV